MPLDKEQVRYLRGLAHTLNPIVMVGNKGVSQTLVDELKLALDRHELVKIKVQAEQREDRDMLIDGLLTSASAELVQRVGHTATLFRRNAKKPKIHLPGDRVRAPSVPRGDAPPRRSDLSRSSGADSAPRPRIGEERAPRPRRSGVERPRSIPGRGLREGTGGESRAPYARREAAPREGGESRAPYARREAAPRAGGESRAPYARRESAPREGGESRAPYARRESGSQASGARRPSNPYARRDELAAESSGERRPYARRETGAFSGAPNRAERSPAVRPDRGEARTPYGRGPASSTRSEYPRRSVDGDSAGERKPYARREGSDGGVRRERDRPTSGERSSPYGQRSEGRAAGAGERATRAPRPAGAAPYARKSGPSAGKPAGGPRKPGFGAKRPGGSRPPRGR